MEYSKDAILFLDILIKRNSYKIWINIYYKSTDTRKCLPFSFNHPNHCKKNIPFTLARNIYTIFRNAEAIECGIKKALSIPLQELGTPKTILNDNKLSFITTYNPNNPNFYEMIEKSVECLKRNKVDGFENLRVIESKWQAPNLKKILTTVEFFQKQVEVFKCPDKRCGCYASLLLGLFTSILHLYA